MGKRRSLSSHAGAKSVHCASVPCMLQETLLCRFVLAALAQPIAMHVYSFDGSGVIGAHGRKRHQ
jgi:hypothetical protein